MFRPRFDARASSSLPAGNQPQTPPRYASAASQPQSRLGLDPLPHLATPDRRGVGHQPFSWLAASDAEDFPRGERLTREYFSNTIPDDEDAIAVHNLLAEGRRFAELASQANLRPAAVQRLLVTGQSLATFAINTGRYSDEMISQRASGMVGRPSDTSEISDDPSVEQSRTPSPYHRDSTAASMFAPNLDHSFSLRDLVQEFSSLVHYISPRESDASRGSYGSAEIFRDGYSPSLDGAPRYSVESDNASGSAELPPSYDESQAIARLDRLNQQIAEAERRLAGLSTASSDSVNFV